MPKGDTDVHYKGYVIRWTGWKGSQCQVCLVGQWVMMGKDDNIIFSGTNGIVGIIKATGVMDMSLKGGDSITIFSSAAAKEMKKQEALAKIIALIDQHDPDNPGERYLPEGIL